MTDTTDHSIRTGNIDAALYGALLERQRVAEARHSAMIGGHFGTVDGAIQSARADGVAEGLAIACEVVAGTVAGAVRAAAIERNVEIRDVGLGHVDECRSILGSAAAVVRAEAHRDRMDDDDYAAALRLAAAERAV